MGELERGGCASGVLGSVPGDPRYLRKTVCEPRVRASGGARLTSLCWLERPWSWGKGALPGALTNHIRPQAKCWPTQRESCSILIFTEERDGGSEWMGREGEKGGRVKEGKREEERRERSKSDFMFKLST